MFWTQHITLPYHSVISSEIHFLLRNIYSSCFYVCVFSLLAYCLLLLFDDPLSLTRFVTGIGLVLFPDAWKASHWLYQWTTWHLVSTDSQSHSCFELKSHIFMQYILNMIFLPQYLSDSLCPQNYMPLHPPSFS